MNLKLLLACAVAASLCPISLAQKPAEKAATKRTETPAPKPEKAGEKPLTQEELLKQIEILTSSLPARDKPDTAVKPPPDVVAIPAPVQPGSQNGGKPAKAPTIITSQQATFDQHANLAIFIDDVYVDGPDFKVRCDKLTAHLKHDDKPKGGAPVAGAPATPSPAPAATPAPTPGDAPEKKKGGGLEKALAESTSDRRVIITQPKTDADGKVSYSVGKADKATYDATTGDVVLYGSPEIFQDSKSIVALEASTVMTLNRDGHMHATGRTKTTIQDEADLK